MLSVSNITKSFGIEKILDRVSFTINAGDRIGLVGPNGCGKTTLLRIIAGDEPPDSGSLLFSTPGLRVGYMPQGMTLDLDQTLSQFITSLEGNLPGLLQEVERLSALLSIDPGNHALQEAFDRALADLTQADQAGRRVPEVLSALGLGDVPGETRLRNLSGGQKTRLALSRVLLTIQPGAPSLLLLDEPTNHLDLDMLAWLEEWLLNPALGSSHGILIVSHDRAFLDNVATGILELDSKTHRVQSYEGNYTHYLEAKLAEMEHHWQEYSDQQEEIARLRSAIAHVRGIARFKVGGKADSGDKFAKGFFANRSKGTVRRAKHLEHRLENLLTEDRVDKPKADWQMKLEFDSARRGGRDVWVCDDLAIGYAGVPLVSVISRTVRHGDRIAIVGANGSGKTTLLRTIAGSIAPVSGRVRLGSGIQVGYMEQEQEDLHPEWDALTTMLHLAPFSETDARAFLHKFLFSGDDVFIPVGNLSFGERARLSLACLVVQGRNFLLLDEPINHLDIPSRARFEQTLANYHGTIIAVVHDRYFIQGFATEIWEIQQGRLLRQVVRDDLLI